MKNYIELKKRLEIAHQYQEECIENYMEVEQKGDFEKRMIWWHKGKRAGIREIMELMKKEGF